MGNYDGPLSDGIAGLKFEPQIGSRARSKWAWWRAIGDQGRIE
jgi:hypothetical protein